VLFHLSSEILKKKTAHTVLGVNELLRIVLCYLDVVQLVKLV
jgi:hypothetical protein